MKTIITSVLAIMLTTGFANATETSTKRTKTNEASVAAVSFATVTMLQEENNQLRSKVSYLRNLNEELQSKMDYIVMMDNMFTQIEAAKQREKETEFKAQVDYSRMMSNMLLQLKTSAQ